MKLDEISIKKIEQSLNDRLKFKGTPPELLTRYSAYDFCYNYFSDFSVNKRTEEIASSENLNNSCLQLGVFLSTWGMYRNSFLQQNSFKIYEPIIKRIAEEKYLWDIDVENYKQERDDNKGTKIQHILDFSKDIKKLLRTEGFLATDTLTTKIMMGVFGCVPAYDDFFRETLISTYLGEESLDEIHKFYCKYKEKLIDVQRELKTVAIDGGLTSNSYKKAKLIDLIGFRVIQREKFQEYINNNEKIKNLAPNLILSVLDELGRNTITMRTVIQIASVPECNQHNFFEHILSRGIGWDMEEIREEKERFLK